LEVRDNPQQFETARNKRQQQGGLQTAKTRVVEHKGIVEHWWLGFALKSFDLSAFVVGDISRCLFDACSTARIFAKTVFANYASKFSEAQSLNWVIASRG
jgi:hypothetical protein